MKAVCDKFVICFVLLGAVGIMGCTPGLTIGAPSETATSGGPVTYTVTYTNASTVTLAAEDVTLNMTDSADGTVAVSGAGTETRTVTISDITGDGTLGITIAEGTAGDAAPAAGPSDTFNVDNTPPGVEIGTPSATATRNGPVSYAVTYTDASSVTLATGDVTLNKTDSANGNVTASTKGLVHTIMITDITGDGTLGVSIAAGTATDALGNAAASAGPSTTFNVDNTGPGAQISAPSVDETASGPVTYTVTYPGANSTSLVTGDVTLNKTDTADGTVSVSAKGLVGRTVTISDTTGEGTLGILIAAGTAADILGNLASAAGPSAIFEVYNLYFSQTYMLPGDVPLVMLSIPAGTFKMGSTTGDADEMPTHAVTVSQPFFIGETEVTQAQWQAVMGTTPWSGQDNVLDDPEAPATWVSWEDAQAFVDAMNAAKGETFRLPTEAEWEYACRAGSTAEYYFGDSSATLSDYAWWNENANNAGEKYPHVVAQLMPNIFGLFDTHGNVGEWCQDWYDSDYYSVSPSTDPTGPESPGSVRVIRGGGWANVAVDCRSAQRGSRSPTSPHQAIGFRLAK